MKDTIDLTDLERKALSVRYDEHGNDLWDGTPTWSHLWMESIGIPNKKLRGVMSSLEKKGLIKIKTWGPKEEVLSFTKKGIRIAKQLSIKQKR